MIGSGNPNPVIPPRSTWFKPGQSGNPGGTAAGARKRLTGNFLRCLEEHFAEHGVDAINRLCKDDPRAYIGAVVKLCPRELEISNGYDGMDNEALQIFMAMAQQYVRSRRERLANATEVPVGKILDAQAIATSEPE